MRMDNYSSIMDLLQSMKASNSEDGCKESCDCVCDSSKNGLIGGRGRFGGIWIWVILLLIFCFFGGFGGNCGGNNNNGCDNNIYCLKCDDDDDDDDCCCCCKKKKKKKCDCDSNCIVVCNPCNPAGNNNCSGFGFNNGWLCSLAIIWVIWLVNRRDRY